MPQTIDLSKYATKPTTSGIDLGSYAQKDVGSGGEEDSLALPTPVEPPGFFKRLGQAFGVPTSMEELQAAQPSTAEKILGPTATAFRLAMNYGKTVSKGLKEGTKEVGEAAQNIAESGPVVPNIIKGGYGGVHAGLQAIPLIGPTVETSGEDVAAKNYKGAAGGVLGAIAQVALPDTIKAVKKGAGLISDVARGAEPHEAITASMTKHTGNVAETSKQAVPALHESAADLGVNPTTPKEFVKTIDNAVRIHEDKVSSLADPMKDEVIPSKDIGADGDNAQLADRLNIGKKNVTVGKLRSEITSMNKELRRANYYALDPTQQAASGLADTAAAAAQGRRVFYDYLQSRSGVDIEPLRQSESALLRLKDMAAATEADLANQSAEFAAKSRLRKVGQAVKAVASVGSLGDFPVNPTNKFTSNMLKAFDGVVPSPAARSFGVPITPAPVRGLGFDPSWSPTAPPGFIEGTKFIDKSKPGLGFDSDWKPTLAPGVIEGTKFVDKAKRGFGFDTGWKPTLSPEAIAGTKFVDQPKRGLGFDQSSAPTSPPGTIEGTKFITKPPNPYNTYADRVAKIMQDAKSGRISPGEADRRISTMGRSVKVSRRPIPPP